MKTLVISGATGLLGSRIVEDLSQDYETHALVRKVPMQPIPHVVYHVADLARGDISGLPRRTDAVIHLAQSAHMREFPVNANDIFKVNTASTASMLDYASRSDASHFVLASTGGLYGSVAGAIVEDSPLNSANGNLQYYFSSKRCAELLAECYASRFNVVVLRPFFIYGERQKLTMLVPRLINNILLGNAIELRGENGTAMNPIYVADAAEAVIASLKLKGFHQINLAGPEITTIRRMAEDIGSSYSISPKFSHQSGPADEIVADISRMCALLVPPKTSFSIGLASMRRASNR